jgi:lipoyl(octanoyl) transferase
VLHVTDLGRLGYMDAWQVQREVHDRVVAGSQPPTLLLVEHEPVITLGRRGNSKHILADQETLNYMGIDVVESDRGGDVTYHGPGQIVVYPILRMADIKKNVSSYMRYLEQAVIDTLAIFDISAQRDHCATGVWVGSEKICAMGVRIRKNVTMHGLALNVSTNLEHFNAIIPCGLVDRPVTSMLQLLGDEAPSMDHVKGALIDKLKHGIMEQ